MDAKVCINQLCAVMIHLLLSIKWAYELMHIKQWMHKCVHEWIMSISLIKWAYSLVHIKQLMHKSASMDCVHYWFALYDL